MLYLDEVRICFLCICLSLSRLEWIWVISPVFLYTPPKWLVIFSKKRGSMIRPPPFLLCLTGLHCRYYCDASPPTGRLNPFNLSNRFRLSWYFFNIDVSLEKLNVSNTLSIFIKRLYLFIHFISLYQISRFYLFIHSHNKLTDRPTDWQSYSVWLFK